MNRTFDHGYGAWDILIPVSNYEKVFDLYASDEDKELVADRAGLDGGVSVSEEKRQFVEDFDDGECRFICYGLYGPVGLVADAINRKLEAEGRNENFLMEPGVVYVCDSRPETEADRNKMLTCEEIRDLFAEFYNPVVESPFVVERVNVDLS